MPRYRIRAADRSGKRVVSFIDAIDAKTARQFQHERGWTVFSIKLTSENRRQQRRLQKASNSSGGMLLRQLGDLLAAGVPVNTAVDEIKNLAPAGILMTAWARLSRLLNEGDSLTHAIKQCPGFMAPRHIAALGAGQSQIDLAQALIDVAEELTWRADVMQRWRQASTYPVFAIALLAVVFVFLITQVVPSLKPLLQPIANDLPWMTQKILLLSDAVSQSHESAVELTGFYLVLMVVAVFCVGWVGHRLGKQESVTQVWLRSRFAQRWVWPFSVAAHAHTIHVLLKQNIPLNQAVGLAAPAAAWLGTKRTWEDIAARVEHDGLFAEAIESVGGVPGLYVALVRVGEQYGTLDKSTAMASEVFNHRYKQRLQRLDVMIGPILLILAGTLIGFVFLWIILPVYDVVALQGGIA